MCKHELICSKEDQKRTETDVQVLQTALVLRTLDLAPPRTPLAYLAEGVMPLLIGIASFLDSPRDLVNLCGLSSKSVARGCLLEKHPAWERLYASRWPVFYEAMQHMGASDWRRIYQMTLSGQCKNLLEIRHREKRPGFALSAMPAWVSWQSAGCCSKCEAKIVSKKAKCCTECGTRLDEAAKDGCYVAKYVSATEQVTERITIADATERLRFCPVAVREGLRPGQMPTQAEMMQAKAAGLDMAAVAPYPYKVLKGVDSGLQVGGGVELQFKNSEKSPFGWWYGRLEELEMEDDERAVATIVFEQFPKDTPYHRQRIEFGDGKLRTAAAGGFSGGLRSCTSAEVKQWKLHGGF